MKVRELIKILQGYPEDYEVYREGDEYRNDYKKVSCVGISELTLGSPKGVMIR